MKCPTCGQNMPSVTSAEQLADVMRQNNICLYMGRDHNYYLERGHGRVARETIDAALTAKLIGPKWEEKPELQYWKAL